MWIQNNDKERIKSYIKSDIESNITNLMDSSNKIRELMSEILYAVGSSASGADQKLLDDCQRALQVIETALCMLYDSKSIADQLDTKEWVDDG